MGHRLNLSRGHVKQILLTFINTIPWGTLSLLPTSNNEWSFRLSCLCHVIWKEEKFHHAPYQLIKMFETKIDILNNKVSYLMWEIAELENEISYKSELKVSSKGPCETTFENNLKNKLKVSRGIHFGQDVINGNYWHNIYNIYRSIIDPDPQKFKSRVK